VDDVDRHYVQAKAAGATILSPPEDKFWGDRSYAAIDREGYRWTFRKIVKKVRLPDSKPK
jgi:PhnB protein